jgi:muramoyltetrapeptide carboxypeptidase
MNIPPPLRPGDRIEVVSPSSPILKEKTERATSMLEAEGYRVTWGKHVFDRSDYLAGTDADRAADLMAAFQNPEVKAVYCSRGGYGCARLFPHLDLDAVAASGKMFLGFSDITTLHLALNRRGLVTYHAPMMLSFSREREGWVTESFLSALRGENPVPDSAAQGTCVVPGIARGEVTGGCLCLLADSLATPDSLDTRGKLVLIEDVDENPHRVDAMLTHLINSGHAQQAAGFIVGEMTGTDEREDASIGGRPWREIVRERLGPLGKPLVIDFPFGHCSNMLTLPLLLVATLDAGQGTLHYE